MQELVSIPLIQSLVADLSVFDVHSTIGKIDTVVKQADALVAEYTQSIIKNGFAEPLPKKTIEIAKMKASLVMHTAVSNSNPAEVQLPTIRSNES